VIAVGDTVMVHYEQPGLTKESTRMVARVGKVIEIFDTITHGIEYTVRGSNLYVVWRFDLHGGSITKIEALHE
jgi:hypothetical protein